LSKRLSDKQLITSIPWARFGFEGTLIVASILAALAVDSWLEYRKEREVEQATLTSLLKEFERNKIELERSMDTLTGSQEAAKRLLTFAGQSLSTEDKELIKQSFYEVYDYWTFDPSTGALNSLLSAGRLDLIQNLELRTRLAGWSGLLTDLQEEEAVVDFLTYERLGPMLSKVYPFPLLEDAAPGRFESQLEGAFSDLELMNTIDSISVVMGDTVGELSRIESEINQIIMCIKAELR
jgi:hypothetical protein